MIKKITIFFFLEKHLFSGYLQYFQVFNFLIYNYFLFLIAFEPPKTGDCLYKWL